MKQMRQDKYLDSLAYRTKWVRISVDAGSEEVFQEYRPHTVSYTHLTLPTKA